MAAWAVNLSQSQHMRLLKECMLRSVRIFRNATISKGLFLMALRDTIAVYSRQLNITLCNFKDIEGS